jgi:hypothetical protein
LRSLRSAFFFKAKLVESVEVSAEDLDPAERIAWSMISPKVTVCDHCFQDMVQDARDMLEEGEAITQENTR